MKISNAFETTTAKGSKVYRIHIDNNEVLSNLEQGKTHMCIDIMTNGGIVQARHGTNKFGKSYKCIHYYTWANEPKEKEIKNESNNNIANPVS